MSNEQQTTSSGISAADSERVAPKRRVLVLDDEAAIQKLLKVVLEDLGHEVFCTDDGHEALRYIGSQPVDLIIQDLRMPKMDGLTFLRMLKDRKPEIPSIVVTAFGTFETAIEAMRLGAYTHLNKPFDTDEIRHTVARALERLEISRKSPRAGVPFLDIISNTSLMSDVTRLIKRIAPTDSTVLITGESGTGKELVARAIHFSSLRADQAFVPVNCGAFAETLLESELFGHLKGSFTGAIADHEGVFKCADRGTLFLDEIGELSLSTQVKILRVLETRMVKPVGGMREAKVDVRFIFATNRHLAQMVADGQFREDLYYRLNVIPIELPPLRERKSDIPLLAGHFLAHFAKRMNKHLNKIDDAAIEKMLAYSWPGNVRELENAIERAVALTDGEKLEKVDFGGMQLSAHTSGRHLPISVAEPAGAAPAQFHETASSSNISMALPSAGFSAGASGFGYPPAAASNHALAAAGRAVPPPSLPPEGMDLERYLLDQERAFIIQALERSNWSLTSAAKLLNMTFRSIRYRVAKLEIERPSRTGESNEF